MTEAPRPDDVLSRLRSLYPTLIDLSLDRLAGLLDRLGHPERDLPPVVHVAGTNGKGSTCAFLRAIAERAGLRVHVMTSPHLISLGERFRVVGRLVTDDALLAALDEVERVNAGEAITVFEALTAAGFLLFARAAADLAVIEVGLGGRLDATNVVTTTAVAAITSISMDHEGFLGNRLAQIAGEKAGIMRRGRPCVTGRQTLEALAVLENAARRGETPLFRRDRDWTIEQSQDGLRYEDESGVVLDLPQPSLLGEHQTENAGIAIAAMLRSGLDLSRPAFNGIAEADWPGRMQRLSGHLAARLPPAFELWLDGGHNEGGAKAIATVLEAWSDRPRYLVVGMKETKDARGFLAPLLGQADGVYFVEEAEQGDPISVDALLAAANGVGQAGLTVEASLLDIALRPPGRVLICGSLHLAGLALRRDGMTVLG